MGDLRPLGSEKLEGMDKINRIIQLSNYKQPNNNNVERNAIDENSTSEYTIKLTDGTLPYTFNSGVLIPPREVYGFYTVLITDSDCPNILKVPRP
jgi:hypothetical protein